MAQMGWNIISKWRRESDVLMEKCLYKKELKHSVVTINTTMNGEEETWNWINASDFKLSMKETDSANVMYNMFWNMYYPSDVCS